MSWPVLFVHVLTAVTGYNAPSHGALQHPLSAAEGNFPVSKRGRLRVELVGGAMPPCPRSARVTMTLKYGVIPTIKGKSVPSS